MDYAFQGFCTPRDIPAEHAFHMQLGNHVGKLQEDRRLDVWVVFSERPIGLMTQNLVIGQ